MPGTRTLARALVTLAAPLLAATPLAAQQPTTVLDLFAGRKEASTEPVFGGLGLTRFGGPLGLRLSGAVHLDHVTPGSGAAFSTAAYDPRGGRGGGYGGYGGGYGGYGYVDNGDPFSNLSIGGWTADADLVFEPLRPVPTLQQFFLGFSPYGFAGIGRVGLRPQGAADTTRTTLSFGAGVRHQFLGSTGLQAEARYRRALDSDSLTRNGLRERLEYRVGFSIGFGGRHAPKPPVNVTVPVVASAPAAADAAPAAPAVSAAVIASRVLASAEGLVNTPFRDGGTTPGDGFDAAGFVRYLYGAQGVALPATAREQAHAGASVSMRVGSLRPGDLLFFANDGTTIDHVAIYAGHDRIIHATASGGRVQYDTLGDGERGQWFADHLVEARRVIGGSQ